MQVRYQAALRPDRRGSLTIRERAKRSQANAVRSRLLLVSFQESLGSGLPLLSSGRRSEEVGMRFAVRMSKRRGSNRRRVGCAVAALVWLLPLGWRAQAAAGVRAARPNVVGAEVAGRGLVSTLNYERFFTNQLGVGCGVMVVGTEAGAVGVVPVYVSMLGGDAHSLYLAGGVTLFTGVGTVHDFESS